MDFSFLFPEKTALRILVVSNICPSERWPLESRDLLPCHSEHSCKYHLQRDTCKLESLTLQGSPRGRSGRPAFHLLAPIGEPRQRTCSLFPDGHGASERHGIYEEQLSCVWLEDTSCETAARMSPIPAEAPQMDCTGLWWELFGLLLFNKAAMVLQKWDCGKYKRY